MALQSSGTIKMSEINTELGRTSSATISLDSAESGTYATINTASASYPNNARPASMSEWYSYDHSASSSSSGFFNVINSGQSTSSAACGLTGPDNLTLYHGTSGTAECPLIGRTVYTDSGQTITFDGQSQYWYSPTCGKSYLITSVGYIEGVFSCVESGNIATDPGGNSNESCQFSPSVLVYKSGSSATPSTGETLWNDSQLSSVYQPAEGFNVWYAYTPSGSSTKYSLFLLQDGSNNTVIEAINTCR
jgi:hypothetical protein